MLEVKKKCTIDGQKTAASHRNIKHIIKSSIKRVVKNHRNYIKINSNGSKVSFSHHISLRFSHSRLPVRAILYKRKGSAVSSTMIHLLIIKPWYYSTFSFPQPWFHDPPGNGARISRLVAKHHTNWFTKLLNWNW